MSVLIASRSRDEGLPVTETYPKVLYAALSGEQYDFVRNTERMIERLERWPGIPLQVGNEHERDAAISTLQQCTL
ncbi:MAG: hypothetical protein AVDCRST_MAG22-1599 [uncultured Rubrobacteraceae bacterium]|uniref:Uncharacterized protein n=1 Tax=uncultured Rubrobacteraceae bacterium TaxID=349277 RepID=A0A6J4P7Q7_9ACTN|nr:MAG: hypothetical protein AVDCRST_MAG22-1599 [uncultured Rubrobacteraceae bacterium]